jgi:phospholipid/cholesterol/gamma-HCH transport system substrate-binding protein
MLDSGSPQVPIVQDGDVLQTQKLISVDDITKTLQQNNQNLLSITGDFKLLARKIVQGKGAVGTLLADSLMGVQLRNSMRNLEITTATAANMAVQLSAFTKKVNTKGGLADKLFTDTSTFNKFTSVVNQLQKASNNFVTLTDKLNKAGDRLNSTDNALGVLLNDPKSAAKLQKMIDSLQQGSVLLNEDLRAAQSNFFLKGYFKKQQKAKADSIKKANKKK